MNALIFYEYNELADAGRQPLSQAPQRLVRRLSQPGRAGFAR
jgi:hypothetical protein